MKKLFTLLFLLFLARGAEAATTRYVDVVGCSGNYSFAAHNCTGSDGDSFVGAAINSALAAMAPGDTVRIRAGTYTTAITVVPICTISASCVIMAETGETVTVTASGGEALSNGSASSAYVTFRNINFTCTGGNDCISFQGNNLRLENAVVTTAGTGLNLVAITQAAHHITVNGGEFTHPGPGGYLFYVRGSNNIIEHVTGHNFTAYGIHNYYQNTPKPNGNIFRYNKFYNGCQTLNTCSAIELASGVGNVVYGTLIYGMTGSGTGAITGVGFSSGGTYGVVYNTTIIGSKFACVSTHPSSSSNIFKNNICSGHPRNHYHDAANDTSLAAFASVGNNRCDFAQASLCSTTATPGFTNAGANDYTLAAGSAMIDAGATSIGSLPPGIEGTYTALGNGLPAIGAFEDIPFASASATTTSVLDITFGAAYAPLSTVASCADVTVRQATATKTCLSFVNNGNATYRWTCTTACLSAGGGTIDIAIAAGKFTDSINIGGTLNQANFALPVTTVTNNISGAAEVFTSRHFRQRTWARATTDTIATAWIKAEDSAGTVRVDNGKFSNFWSIDCTIADCPSVGFLFEANLNGGAFANVTDSCLTNPTCFDSTNSAASHGTVIPTSQLTDALGNYLAGAVAAQASSYPVLDLALNQSTQIQGNFAIKSGLVAGTDRICIRPKLDSGAAVTHAQTACFDVVNPGGNPA